MMEKASAALAAGHYFECERLADESLHKAWRSEQFDLVARITLPLQEARRQRRIEAVEADAIHMVEERGVIPGHADCSTALQAGCYIVQAPNVGADARQIRLAALEQEIPVIALACEPMSQLGLLPIVVVGPSALRTKVKPPAAFTASWCLSAIDALTNEGLAMVDRTRPAAKQVDRLLDLVDSLPESELLHQELAHAAEQAASDKANT